MTGAPLARYLLRRVGQAVLVLWAAFTVSFLVLVALPGDSTTIAAGGTDSGGLSDDQLAALRAAQGYDRPVVVQYLDQLGSLLRGDLGTSAQTGQPVTAALADAIPSTVQLAGLALLLAVVGGAGLALVATGTRSRWLRQALLSLPAVGISVPTFWVGLLLVQAFSFRLRWFPAVGEATPAALVLPAVTLALPTGAVIAQVLAKSLLTTLDEPFVTTARAKGVGRVLVHLRHAVPNAVPPALTVAGVLVGSLLAGSVVVESVFSRTGVGRLTITAVTAQDTPVVQGVVVLGAVLFVGVNLLVDLAVPLLDPRVTTAPTRQEASS